MPSPQGGGASLGKATFRVIVYAMINRTDLPLVKPVEDLKNQASEVVRIVGDQLNEQANVLRDATVSARYNTQEFIENNPWQSVIMAGAIGFLVGAIIARR